jgi:transcriptional regulator with XRE-family HTH domain
VSDLSEFVELKDKEFRDEYMSSHVRAGICYQLQALREQLGLTQTEFARLVGKPQTVISRLENVERSRVSTQTLLDIACGLDIALLVRFVDYPTFLHFTKDVTPESLWVETFGQSVERYASTLSTPSMTAKRSADLGAGALLAGQGPTVGVLAGMSGLVGQARGGVNESSRRAESAAGFLQPSMYQPTG